jgi:hypothetical protein
MSENNQENAGDRPEGVGEELPVRGELPEEGLGAELPGDGTPGQWGDAEGGGAAGGGGENPGGGPLEEAFRPGLLVRLQNWAWFAFVGVVGFFSFMVIGVVLGVLGGLHEAWHAWGATMEDISEGEV